MPEISLLGWFHTGIAIIALITGVYSLAKFKVIPVYISPEIEVTILHT